MAIVNYVQTHRTQLAIDIRVKETFPWIGPRLSLLLPDYVLHDHLQDGAIVNGKVFHKVPVIQKQLSVLALQRILLPDVRPLEFISTPTSTTKSDPSLQEASAE